MPAMKSAVEMNTAKDVASHILAFFADLGKGQPIDMAKLQRLFAKNFEFFSNTHHIAHNLQGYQERLKNIQSRFPKITYSKLLEEPIIAGNKVVIQYNATLQSPSGSKHEATVMAILTIEEDKVTKWQEVIHEKGSGRALD